MKKSRQRAGVAKYATAEGARKLLTWRPALAECDLVVLTWESPSGVSHRVQPAKTTHRIPFPPVFPPVLPAITISFTSFHADAVQVRANLYRQAYLMTIS